MSATNYKCPSCDGRLLAASAPDTYECKRCGGQVKEAIAENRDALETLAESDLSCSWIAEELLNANPTGGSS